MLSKRKKLAAEIATVLILVGAGYFLLRAAPAAKYKTEAEKNVYVRFDMEAYDLISQNYWKEATSSDIAQLFQLSLQKAENLPMLPIMKTADRSGTADMLLSAIQSASSTDAKKQMALAGWRPPEGVYRNHRIMGKVFDATRPDEYLKSFAIRSQA